MNNIIFVWRLFLFMLMFSSFQFHVECRAMGPGPPGGGRSSSYAHQTASSLYPYPNPSCPVLEGPSSLPQDITVKVWESAIVLEGTARSRSEIRLDGSYGVTFDLHRVIKGDAPILRRRKQFRIQFLDNPEPRVILSSNRTSRITPTLRQQEGGSGSTRSIQSQLQLYNKVKGEGHQQVVRMMGSHKIIGSPTREFQKMSRNSTRSSAGASSIAGSWPLISNVRKSRNVQGFGRPSIAPKCLPPKATVKTGRRYVVFAAKVDNHFIAVYSPELANKRNTKDVDGVLCKGCGQAPSVVVMRDIQLKVKDRVRLRCRLRAGNPIPVLKWYKDGRPLNVTEGRFRLREKRRQSILVIRKTKEMDSGLYSCEGKNVFGSAHANVRVTLPPAHNLVSSHSQYNNSKPTVSSNKPGTTPTTLWPLESSECPYDSYCLNGGTCSYYETIGEFVCQCSEGYKGQRCDTKDIPNSSGSHGSDYDPARLFMLWE